MSLSGQRLKVFSSIIAMPIGRTHCFIGERADERFYLNLRGEFCPHTGPGSLSGRVARANGQLPFG
jgi:hypothetical protein